MNETTGGMDTASAPAGSSGMKKEELVQLLIRLVIEQADASRGNFGKGYYLLNYPPHCLGAVQ